MDRHISHEPEELHTLARKLRESARAARLAGYADRLIHAAEEVEKLAADLEANFPRSR